MDTGGNGKYRKARASDEGKFGMGGAVVSCSKPVVSFLLGPFVWRAQVSLVWCLARHAPQTLDDRQDHRRAALIFGSAT